MIRVRCGQEEKMTTRKKSAFLFVAALILLPAMLLSQEKPADEDKVLRLAIGDAKLKSKIVQVTPGSILSARTGKPLSFEKMIGELEQLEPFGTGNPQPLFISRNLMLKGSPQLLGRDTIKFWVSDGKLTYQAIGFGKAALRDSLVNAKSFDLIYTPRFDTWQDNTTVLLEAEDILCRG